MQKAGCLFLSESNQKSKPFRSAMQDAKTYSESSDSSQNHMQLKCFRIMTRSLESRRALISLNSAVTSISARRSEMAEDVEDRYARDEYSALEK
jgi:hypothetical protein